jgi:hypothetical protein
VRAWVCPHCRQLEEGHDGPAVIGSSEGERLPTRTLA